MGTGERALPAREEGIVYSDYMGSGLGNKPSHGGNGYKIGSMVATVLFLISVSKHDRDETKRVAPTRGRSRSKATSKKQKDRSTRGDRYTRAKSAWLRGHTTAQGRGTGVKDGRREREDGAAMKRNRARERGKYDEKGGMTKRREPQHREPSYWNLNNNYSV